jgi:prevent-host-death family protein
MPLAATAAVKLRVRQSYKGVGMRIYNVHDAKTNLSRLIEETANGGEPFVIAKLGKPLVKVVRIDAGTPKPPRRIRFMKGQMKVPAEFCTMGSDEISDLFEGKLR